MKFKCPSKRSHRQVEFYRATQFRETPAKPFTFTARTRLCIPDAGGDGCSRMHRRHEPERSSQSRGAGPHPAASRLPLRLGGRLDDPQGRIVSASRRRFPAGNLENRGDRPAVERELCPAQAPAAARAQLSSLGAGASLAPRRSRPCFRGASCRRPRPRPRRDGARRVARPLSRDGPVRAVSDCRRRTRAGLQLTARSPENRGQSRYEALPHPRG